jgi:PAT family beta-lactamase induction signal transducer AmpG
MDKKWNKLIPMVLLGFLSGLPLALSASTFRIWLTEIGINMTSIGYLSMVAMPYTLKFLWAPIIDRYPLPILTNLLGRRKSWMFVTQILLAISIIMLGYTDPNEQLFVTAIFATIMTFFAASQDLIIDAYRIESLTKQQQGLGVSIFIYGYRMGMLASGAGALLLSEYLSWLEVYSLGALVIIMGAIIAASTLKEPDVNKSFADHNQAFYLVLKQLILEPLMDFAKKPNWQIILLFTIFFKLGDAMTGVMTESFLINIGFDKLSIAKIVKTFGLAATLSGTFFGGIIIYRLGMVKSLWVCAILQLLTNGLFSIQAIVGASNGMLACTIGAENFASGMGSTVFIAYLGSICSANFTATQYSLLSSLAPLGRILFASPSGYLAEKFGWVTFFLLTMIAAMPGLIMLSIITKSFKKKIEA